MNATSSLKKICFITLGVALAVFLIISLRASCANQPGPDAFVVLPNGYIGTVQLRYSDTVPVKPTIEVPVGSDGVGLLPKDIGWHTIKAVRYEDQRPLKVNPSGREVGWFQTELADEIGVYYFVGSESQFRKFKEALPVSSSPGWKPNTL
jgi:hypothetical protein